MQWVLGTVDAWAQTQRGCWRPVSLDVGFAQVPDGPPPGALVVELVAAPTRKTPAVGLRLTPLAARRLVAALVNASAPIDPSRPVASPEELPYLRALRAAVLHIHQGMQLRPWAQSAVEVSLEDWARLVSLASRSVLP